jgi:hypothetical protein
MKTSKHIRSLFLACATLASLLITPATVRADSNGTKPYKGSEVTVSRTDGLAPGHWTDPFLAQTRLTAPGLYLEDSEVISEGHDNYNGPFTEVDHQMLFVTNLSPLEATVYIWAEKTYPNGHKVWAAVTGRVDFSTGNVAGEWVSFVANDPTSAPSGSGTWTSVALPELGERFYDTTIVGRAVTVGALKHR